MKMEEIVCSETSAIRTQTPGNYPKDNMLHTEHGESLKSRKLTYLLTYSMEQNPSWEANWFSTKREVPSSVWNLKVHYCIHKCPPPAPILSQLDPVYTPTSHFLKIHLNIILLSTPGSPKWSLLLRFPCQNPVNASPLLSPICAIWPAHLILFYFITQTILGEQYRSLSCALCRFLHPLVTSSLLGAIL